MDFLLQGARLVDATRDLARADIAVTGSVIAAAGPSEPRADHRRHAAAGVPIDASGMIVTPGFIEVHTHGGGGYNLHTTDPDELRAYASWIPRTGVT